ncbi:hypothetical protein FRC14_004272 [Serendipita sp. 396]|nr:hypothetical protein FRC14_004272 [Serendipita sp. 396]KAG8786950.1 hypothetical protein FRC15_010358 [Serendipita sp. 397]KAG8802183.1 hypothetical protein FRC16_010225 [Serendipita sp. 398]KAG8871287.1 hypothetical protein FRC20_010730 [Serendipita sp. 405]
MPIETLPIEIWEEILEWLYVDGGVPMRNHAKVCRQWRQILLNLPTLWRTIELSTATGGVTEELCDQLERRLHHAKGVTLDVTLSHPRGYQPLEGTPYMTLVKKLTQHGPIDRWRSLAIFDTYYEGGRHIHGVFSGRFTSLRSFTVTSNVYCLSKIPDPHIALFELIIRSNPPLRHLGLQIYYAPRELIPLLRLQTITTLRGTFGSLHTILPEFPPQIHDLTINGWYGTPNPDWPHPSKVLPQCSITILNYQPLLARGLCADKVLCLHIDGFAGWEKSDTVLELPILHTLHLRPCQPQFLQVFKAPKVQVLKLSKAHKQNMNIQLKLVRRENRAHSIPVFRNRQLLTSYPISLTIEVEEITDGLLVMMLEAWPQLKYLSIVFGGDFDIFGFVAKRLLDKASPLCPQLETIDMDVWWYEKGRKWRKWREVAEEMMSRRNGSLDRITWRNHWFGVESVTRATSK